MDEMTLELFEKKRQRRLVCPCDFGNQAGVQRILFVTDGNKVYFGPENMQYTGLMQSKRAYHKISTMSKEEEEKGLITACGKPCPGRGLRGKALPG